MGFDEGQIVLNSESGSYFPGQMLCGRLEFDLDKNKTFRGIYVEIKGRCKVHWTTSHTRRVNDRTQHYTVTHESYEEYMNLTIYLIGSKSGEQTLHPGRHVFPFECQIPPQCPSSFEGSEGNVRYRVKVTVDRAFKIDQTKLAMFRVVAPLDLNTVPNCSEPLAMEFEQTFCCWCMNSGMAETLVKLPARGWCPNQIMPIELACNNTSGVEIDIIKFEIKKITTFEAVNEPDERSEEETIATLKKGPIPAHTTRNWTVEMTVPDMEVPNLSTCRFINIDYRFKVKIETSGCHVDEDETRTIYIGTIPLASLTYPPNSNLESAQNVQGAYNQPIVNQPLPYSNGAPYPGNNPSIGFNPQNTPYPTAAPYPTVSPYPVSPSNTPYPPSPSANPPYPSQNPTTNSPYPNSGRNSPYPGTPNMVAPYPTPPNVGTSPYPPQNTNNTPYPVTSAPYTPNVAGTTLLKTGNIGFPGSNNSRESMPLLPPGAVPRPVSPFASASAPAPPTPDEEAKTDEKVPPYPQ